MVGLEQSLEGNLKLIDLKFHFYLSVCKQGIKQIYNFIFSYYLADSQMIFDLKLFCEKAMLFPPVLHFLSLIVSKQGSSR